MTSRWNFTAVLYGDGDPRSALPRVGAALNMPADLAVRVEEAWSTSIVRDDVEVGFGSAGAQDRDRRSFLRAATIGERCEIAAEVEWSSPRSGEVRRLARTWLNDLSGVPMTTTARLTSQPPVISPIGMPMGWLNRFHPSLMGGVFAEREMLSREGWLISDDEAFFEGPWSLDNAASVRALRRLGDVLRAPE